MDKEGIYSQIQSLKSFKKGTAKDSSAIELIKSTGYVNIIDMLLLPLYFSWEHSKFGTLEEVAFETYLINAYCLYTHSKRKCNNQLIKILKKTSHRRNLSHDTRNLVNSLIETYSNFE